jgi:hypothetical protein
MKSIHSLPLFLAMVHIAISLQHLQAETAIYVSPSGNDEWSGTLPEPNASRTNGPLKSPEAALLAVRAMKSQPLSQKPGQTGAIHVYFRQGTYYLPQPLRFRPEDSGTRERAVEWSAYPHERAVLSGGKRITHWMATNVNNHAAWIAPLPEGIRASDACSLWQGNARYGRARWPKRGTLPVAGITTPPQKQMAPGSTSFVVAEKDLQTPLRPRDGEVVVTNRWVESHLPLAAIDSQKRIISFNKRSVFVLEVGDRYWFENLKEHLTEPGEFYVDADARTVTLIAPAGVDPNAAEIVVPHLSQILSLEGDAKRERLVERITFRNLAFAHAAWSLEQSSDPSTSGFPQAAIGVPGAIRGWGIRNCTWENCEVSHIGNYAFELAEGCRKNRIRHCTLADLGAGGVKLGEVQVRDDARQQAAANELSDCTIADGGHRYPSCVAVWIGQSHDNHIIHNDIHDFWYTGISIGWTWGYGKALAQHNMVEYNHIHHIGMKSDDPTPILSDMGGIYTLGNQEGTTIRFNSFHDIAALKYGGWGIYFDEGTTHILAENNLVYRTTHGGFHQHYGRENMFRNNIIAYGRDAQFQRTRPEAHQSFAFEKNIVYWDHGVLLAGNWSKLGVSFDHNTYWRVGGGPIKFDGRTWEEWQKAGLDLGSKIADPRFKAAESGDFSLTAESAAALAGFTAFDLSGVGPRK